jgi:hypothetical protein
MQFTSQLEQGDWYIMASWFCVVLALALYGLGLLINKIRPKLPRPRRRRTAADGAVRQPSRAPAKLAAPLGKPSHWASVIEIVESGLAHAEATWAWHAAAGEQIDAAEYALCQLIAECRRTMPAPEPMLAAPSAVRPATAGPSLEPLAA